MNRREPRTYTVGQVAEDLAMLLGRSSMLDESVVGEVRRSPLAERQSVVTALAEVDHAQVRLLEIACVEAREEVAAWLAYDAIDKMLGKLDDIFVLAGVRHPLDRYRGNHEISHEEWTKQWRRFVASGRAWEMRSC